MPMLFPVVLLSLCLCGPALCADASPDGVASGNAAAELMRELRGTDWSRFFAFVRELEIPDDVFRLGCAALLAVALLFAVCYTAADLCIRLYYAVVALLHALTIRAGRRLGAWLGRLPLWIAARAALEGRLSRFRRNPPDLPPERGE